jgi:hypothetical protein
MDVAAQKAGGNAGFKVVCDQCGSLSIKLANPASEALTTPIQCGRCSAARGTLADLQDLARRGTDIFEF